MSISEQFSMEINSKNFQWIREPAVYSISEKQISITTEPHTDLWQRTYYHFCNDSAPVFQIETEEPFFSFVVKTDFSGSHHRFDQCGVVLYLDSENWLKASVEFENEEFQHLGSVVTNHGYSDWATTAIAANQCNVVSPQPQAGRLLHRVLTGWCAFFPDAHLPYVGGRRDNPIWNLCVQP